MKTSLLTYIFLIFSHYVYGENIPSIIEAVHHSVVRIQSIGDGYEKQGTGFFINHTTLVTSFHSIAKRNEEGLIPIKFIQVDRIGQETNHSVTITRLKALSLIHDLALLEVEGYHGPILTPGEFTETERVYTVGFPNGKLKTIAGKNIQNRETDFDFFANDSSLSGSSGSPVFNSHGQFIGIALSALDNHISNVKSTYLKELQKNQSFTISDQTDKLFHQAMQDILQSGDSYAQFKLGLNYFNGTGIHKDFVKSMEFLIEAAIKDHAPAQYQLGVIAGIMEDYENALKSFILATSQDYAPAQYQLARMYLFGEGVPINISVSVELVTMAANQGYSKAKSLLEKIPTANN